MNKNVLKEAGIPLSNVEISMMVIDHQGKEYCLEAKRFLLMMLILRIPKMKFLITDPS